MNWLFGASRPLRAVAVTTATGSTIIGALVDARRDALVLRAARALGVDQNGNPKSEQLDGDVVIPMANVDYWQDALDPAVLTRIA
jgi:hypothetical protein